MRSRIAFESSSADYDLGQRVFSELQTSFHERRKVTFKQRRANIRHQRTLARRSTTDQVEAMMAAQQGASRLAGRQPYSQRPTSPQQVECKKHQTPRQATSWGARPRSAVHLLLILVILLVGQQPTRANARGQNDTLAAVEANRQQQPSINRTAASDKTGPDPASIIVASSK